MAARTVDFRAGKTYEGPSDQSFLKDSLFWAMRTHRDDVVEAVEDRDDLRVAFNIQDANNSMMIAAAAAEGWVTKAAAGTLNFAQIYAVAKVLGCAAKSVALGADPEPEVDPAKLQANITSKLAAEWDKVIAASKELRDNPSVLGLAASGDAAALRAHLEGLMKAEPAAPVAPATPAPVLPVPPAPSANRQKRRFWPFRRSESPATEAVAEDPPAAALTSPRPAPSLLRQELLERCSRGASALMIAIDFGYDGYDDCGYGDCVDVLLEAAAADGADSDTLKAIVSQHGRDDFMWQSPCTLAIHRERFDVLLSLVRHGVDLHAPINNPSATSRPKISVLELLVMEASNGVEGGIQALQEVLKSLAEDPKFDINGSVMRRQRNSRSRRRISADLHAEDGAEDREGEEEEEEEDVWGDDEGGGDGLDNDEQIRREEDRIEQMMRRMWRHFEYEDDTAEFTMLDVAAARRHGARVDVIKLLLAAGATPSAETLVKAVHKLADSYSTVAEVVNEGNEALNAGVAAGVAAFALLLDAIDDVNATTRVSKSTALHEAASVGCVPAAKMLLARKADTTLRDAVDMTPMQLAEDNGERAMVELLARQHRLRRLLSGSGGSSARRRQSAEAENTPDEERCVICCLTRKEVIAAPCGHRSTCKRCTKALLTRPTKDRNCPVCRERIDSYVLTVYEV